MDGSGRDSPQLHEEGDDVGSVTANQLVVNNSLLRIVGVILLLTFFIAVIDVDREGDTRLNEEQRLVFTSQLTKVNTCIYE